MRDQDKAKQQLIDELNEMRQQFTQLGESEEECKQLLEKLQESDEIRLAIMNTAPDFVAVVDERINILHINEPMARRFGKRPEELAGTCGLDLLTPELAISRKKHFDEVLQTSQSYRWEDESRGMYFDNIAFPVRVEDGKVTRIALIARDITERRQTEEALKESEERYRALFESELDGVAVIDETMKVLLANKAAADMFGFDSAEELLELDLFDYVAPGEKERILELRDDALAGNYLPSVQEFRCVKRSGEEIWVGATITVIEYQGAVAGLVSFRDITERMKMEKALSESEERYRNIVEMSPDGIVTLNVYGIVTSCNAAFVNLTGYPESEILGKHIAEIPVVKPSDIPVVTELFTTLLTFDRPETVEWQWIRKDGTQKVGEFRMGLIEEAGVTSGFQIVVRDITGYRHMEEERRRIERLESLGTLAGGIAHDFNNLLTGIMGNISLIRDYLEPGSKEAERLLEAERASLRAKDLTQQLLTFARGGEPIKETVAVGGLIEDAANFALGGSKSACVFDIPENLWQAHADKGQMSEVVNNLVINADEAMPGGGMINISARNRVFREESSLLLPKGDYIELSIEDHGLGIPEEYLARIYEPYFTTKTKGSGLGLATTYSIIKNHEGLITVDSTPGVGTIFRVYLPATRKSSISFEEEAEDILSSLTGKILIMDDEEAIRRLLERALTEAGHDITTAKDGTEAIEQYVGARERGQPFDLVILDLTVPGGMGGVEAMAKLLEIDPDIKSIVSSGYSSDPIMADYEKYGFGAVIAKPYRVHELRRMILKILQQK